MKIAVRGLCPLLQVFDMAASLRFYRDIVGFSEVEKSGEGDDVGWVRLRHGDAELMLNTAYEDAERPRAPDPARRAAHGDTILFLGCQDLEGAYSYLVAQRVEADPPMVRPFGMTQVNVTDPDGYKLCLQWPTRESVIGSEG